MRAVVTASLCVLLLSGCAGATDAALTAQDAKNNVAIKDQALAQLATTQIAAISQQAQAFAALNGGSMVGFAADLQATQPSVASSVAALSDTSVSMATGTGQCLTAALPVGLPVAVAC